MLPELKLLNFITFSFYAIKTASVFYLNFYADASFTVQKSRMKIIVQVMDLKETYLILAKRFPIKSSKITDGGNKKTL